MSDVITGFNIAINETYVIAAANLMAGEQVAVEFAAYEDCEGTSWIPYSPCGTPILIDEYYNPVTISTPGRYRITPVGSVNTNVKVSAVRVGSQKTQCCTKP